MLKVPSEVVIACADFVCGLLPKVRSFSIIQSCIPSMPLCSYLAYCCLRVKNAVSLDRGGGMVTSSTFRSD